MSAPLARTPPVPIRCRPLGPEDHERVARLLARGFPTRDRAFWHRALARLQRHNDAQPIGHPGHVLQAGPDIVGALLTIYRRVEERDTVFTRCNLSSWFVEDAYRGFAPLLVKTATRDKTVTFVNISPARGTEASVEAQGFQKYCSGIHVGFPLLSAPPREAVRCIAGATVPPGGTDPVDLDLMRAHTELACLTLWCEAGGRVYPFVFTIGRRFHNLVPTAHVVYCADPDLVCRFARPIGIFLAKRGIVALSMDADGPLRELPGRFRANDTPKYFKGPHRPRLGDLSYTELPMFGV